MPRKSKAPTAPVPPPEDDTVTEETPAPKKRGAPKSELAAAARTYETANRRYEKVLERWQRLDAKASAAKAELDQLVVDRDAARETLEKALG